MPLLVSPSTMNVPEQGLRDRLGCLEYGMWEFDEWLPISCFNQFFSVHSTPDSWNFLGSLFGTYPQKIHETISVFFSLVSQLAPIHLLSSFPNCADIYNLVLLCLSVSLFVVFAFKKILFSMGLVRNTSTPFCQGKGELLLPPQTFACHCQLQDLSVGLSYFIGRRLVLWLGEVIKVYLFWMDCQCFSTNLLKYGNSSRLNLGIFFKWALIYSIKKVFVNNSLRVLCQ